MKTRELTVIGLLSFLSLSFIGVSFATHDNDGDHTTIGKWIDYEIKYSNEVVFVIDGFPVIVDNSHVTEIILDWDNPGLPEGEVFFDSIVNGTLGMQIPKNMPRTMNLDFGSSLFAFPSSDLIVELESECFYILEIPLGTDHVIFGSGSVTAGRWEPVIKDNTSCHSIYQDLIDLKAPKHSFAEESSSEYHLGKLQWLEASYPPNGTAVVRVVDPDMNLNPQKIDFFDVFVWSDSHTKGLYLTMTETDTSTGIFDGTLFLSLNHEAVGHRLKVADGDTITAKYDDDTLPAYYTNPDVLSITSTSEILSIPESPQKQFKSGVPVDEIKCKQDLVLIQKHDGSPACVKPETKTKLIEREWTSNMSTNLSLQETQSWGYIKEISILDSHYVGITMSYPTNEAYHEISPDEYNSIIGDCNVQHNSAKLSILYLKAIDHDTNTITFTEKNKIFDNVSCNDAFWAEIKQHGYCGPPPHSFLQTETLISSIDDAQKNVGFVLDVPKYLPSEYEIQKIMVDADRKHATLFISSMPVTNETDMCEFTWDDEGIHLSYVSIPNGSPRFANDPDKERITINGNSGYVEHRWVADRFGTPIPQGSEIIWHLPENNLVLDMFSSLPSEELIKIAESIDEK